VVDLSARCRFRLSGADRVRYLNGQVTNDVRHADSASAMHALVTDIKAHIVTDIYLHAREDALYFDAEESVREVLAARLERYIIADDAVLEDVTEQWQLWHHFGPAASAMRSDPGALTSTRFGEAGIDLWMPALAEMPSAEAPLLTPGEAEALRILRAIPRHPQELNQDTFPAEVGLDHTAVSFTKGCYIGQEVISRMKTTGKMPRQMVQWQSEMGDSISSGMVLSQPESPEKLVGVITSVVTHPESGVQVGLGFVRQSMALVDSRLLARSEPPTLAAIVKLTGPAT
jgi:tRNA-modifying protein YgfZ